MEKIVDYLFETQAIEVSSNEPFWYTSGDIGPFYINTHYLYGSKSKATQLLQFIDENKNNIDFEKVLSDKIMANYNNDSIFNYIISQLVTYILKSIDISKYEYISGGERRDWLFSIPVAKILNMKHLFLYKDIAKNIFNIKDKKVLHICDLVNLASSYIENWIPSIQNNGGILKETFSIVDRMQGGKEALNKNNVQLYSLIEFNIEIFKRALDYDKINTTQFNMVKAYLEDSKKFMLDFVKNNKNFIIDAINNGGKEKIRAEKFLEKYNE